MEQASQDTLLVEVFLSNGRAHGITHEVHDRRRLVDVLTDGSPAFRLESARVFIGSSSEGRQFESINIEKRSILAAIPRETPQQQHARSMLTSTVGRSPTRALQATLLIPPFIVEGGIHVSASVGNIGSSLTADPQIFARFLSVTDAKLILPGGTEVETSVLAVNRDLIAGISVAEKRRSLGD